MKILIKIKKVNSLGISISEHKERMFWYDKGLTDKEIGNKVHRTRYAIYRWRKNNNLSANGKKFKIGDHTLRKIFFYSQLNLSYNEIAKKSNCSVGSVYYWLNKSEG